MVLGWAWGPVRSSGLIVRFPLTDREADLSLDQLAKRPARMILNRPAHPRSCRGNAPLPALRCKAPQTSSWPLFRRDIAGDGRRASQSRHFNRRPTTSEGSRGAHLMYSKNGPVCRSQSDQRRFRPGRSQFPCGSPRSSLEMDIVKASRHFRSSIGIQSRPVVSAAGKRKPTPTTLVPVPSISDVPAEPHLSKARSSVSTTSAVGV